MIQIPEFEKYPFKIEPLPQDEGGGFAITFPDLPGCLSDGDTYEEAIANGRDAFKAWMEAQIEDGKRPPEPNGAGQPAKFLQRIPQSMHGRLLARAAAEGVSLNTLVATFIADGLARYDNRPVFAVVESRVSRIIKLLDQLETRAVAAADTSLLIQEFSGSASKRGRRAGLAEASGTNFLFACSSQREAPGR